MKICGFAETSWRQKNRRGKERKRRLYQGRVDYLASTTFLVGSENNKHDINIDGGTHTYNFYCTIPEVCPSSFESTTGFIRYLAKVVVLRSKKADKVYTTAFTVLKKVDLNTDTSVIKGPIQAEVVKMVSSGFFSKKPLIMRVDIPQNGFVSGQAIMINTQIDNQSNTPLKGIRFALNLVATYHSQLPRQDTRVEKINLCKVKSAPVDKQTTVNFMEILRVPPTPPSCPDLCKIIQISYEIDVMAKISGVHLSPSLVIPIIVGNVPLTVSPQTDVALQKSLEAKKSDKAIEAEGICHPPTSVEAVITQPQASSIQSTGESTTTGPLYDGCKYNFCGIRSLFAMPFFTVPPSYDEAMAMAVPSSPPTKPFSKKVEDDSDSEIEVVENEGDDDDDDEDEEVEIGERAMQTIYPVLEMGILVDVSDNRGTNPFVTEKK